MYVRLQKIKRPNGSVDEYVQILESYRQGGKVRQKIIANLGNRRLLKANLDSLIFLVDPDRADLIRPDERAVEGNSVVPQVSAPYGIVFLVHSLFAELNLWDLLDSLSDSTGWADRVALLVANRLSGPTSEHGLGAWLEKTYVVDRQGERFLPVWKQQRRVKVDLVWLNQFYRTLDILTKHKERIEKELYFRLRDLFHLKVDIVFYDLTSTYFEGEGPSELARYGYSRDGKSHNRQVLVGVVMVNGFPLAHHVFEGNTKDSNTVDKVIEDLEERFEVGRIVFVGDRGMMTKGTLKLVRERGQGYLMGLTRRRRPEIAGYIEKAVNSGPGIECGAGVAALEKAKPLKTLVWEVRGNEEGVRIFVVHSEERERYERAMRERSMERVRVELENLKSQVSKGRIKSPQKIGARAARILTRNKGSRYYDWRLSAQGEFEYFEHPINFKLEKKIEGKYLIQTEEQNLTAVEAVAEYKELTEVERGFRSLKDVIELRPIYHQKGSRVQAHIFVAALAFLFERVLEKKLTKGGSALSAADALNALQTISAVEFAVGGSIKKGVTPGSARARETLTVLGLDNPELPGQ
jgi:transposase